MWASTLLLWILVNISTCSIEQRFPPWFKFGAASSSYQVEGAWNVSDKGQSRWDHITHSSPQYVPIINNADVSCDSYHLWRRDIEMASQINLQFYRFSISWPRLLPNGFSNKISEDGKRYYNNLINGLLEKGIEPMVTMYHFDLPQILQDLGGWTNPLISDWYADYARVLFTLFGDRVKTWITMNEPQLECDLLLMMTVNFGVKDPGHHHNVGPYLCNKYILIAHAKAWRIYDEEFRPIFNGKLKFQRISITNHLLWLIPFSEQDKVLTETAMQFLTGRYSHPIYSKEGGWPSVVETTVKKFSKQLGYFRSNLPPFTEEEIALVKGTFDFYGMNHYTSRLVRPARPGEQLETFIFSTVYEINAVLDIHPGWRSGQNKLLPINPEGIRQQMHWLRQHYGDMEIMITENGYSTVGNNLNDDDRTAFIRTYLEQILMSISEGINVTRYSYWSMMDSFEFFEGYSPKFGLFEVDFADPMRRRTPRKSAHYYSHVIRTRSLHDEAFNSLNYNY